MPNVTPSISAPLNPVRAELVEALFFFLKKEEPFDRLRANGGEGGSE
jgi:hypothetical protein